MPNHKKIEIKYDCNEILNILQKYSFPIDNKINIDACSLAEIIKISKILNLNIPIISILYFRMGPSSQSHIHIDRNINSPKSNVIKHALNFPLYNCDNVFMRWYKQIDETINEKPFGGPSFGSPTPLLNYNNAMCIDEVNCNQVNLVNIQDWHAIENRTLTEFSCLISIRFNPYIKTSSDWIL